MLKSILNACMVHFVGVTFTYRINSIYRTTIIFSLEIDCFRYAIHVIWIYTIFNHVRYSKIYLQVCIVQKRDSGRLYAMKYVNRSVLDGRGALGGVIKEVELLSTLEHPFLVNLWFSFQGEPCHNFH